MDAYLLWLIGGFVLVIAELLTGTFYLLVLGIAAFAGAAAAYLSPNPWAQTLTGAVVAVAGVLWVRSYHQRKRVDNPPMAPLDAGQPVSFDAWSSQGAGLARVRYRDTLWDARIEGEAGAPVRGDVFYIIAMDGSTLRVARGKS
ncbi:MAG TPA: NfeD family protein [Burkholderiales bacterium]|nr:NfeD family protein [Burkholderiales bacterium]